MKKIVVIVMAIASLALNSCGGKKEVVVVEGMMELDLSSYGLPVTISIPDSTKAKLEVEDAKDGTKKIRVGKSFRISLFEDAGDIALKKSDVSGDEVKKLKRFIVDEPTTILYENQVTEPEFHFYTIVTIGDKTIVVQDIDGEEYYSEEATRIMLESAKSIKLKEQSAS